MKCSDRLRYDQFILRGIRIISGIGALPFCVFFLTLVFFPGLIERSAESFIRAQVDQEFKILQESGPGRIAQESLNKAKDSISAKTAEAKKFLETSLAKKIASEATRPGGAAASLTSALKGFIDQKATQVLDKVKPAMNDLETKARAKYQEILSKLITDLKIFSGGNVLLFAAIIAVSLVYSGKAGAMIVPFLCLLASLIINTWLYLFGQNWFYTIIFSAYAGWANLVFALVMAAFFMDLSLNRGRETIAITGNIGEGVLQALIEAALLGHM